MNKYLKWGWRALSVALVVLVMATIFSYSHKRSTSSLNQSDKVTETIMGIFSENFHELSKTDKKLVISQFQVLIRKSAHFIIYLALGFFSCNMFYSFKIRMARSGIFALILSALYAVSDEIHQYFVPGRACTFSDIVLDTVSAVLGIVIFAAVALFIMAVIRKIKEKRTAG